MADLMTPERRSDFGTTDAGNSSDTATVIPFGAPISGRVGDVGDANDWYRITAPVAGFFTIRLTGLADDIDLVVRDAALRSLGSSTRVGIADETVSNVVLLGGQSALIHVDPYLTAASDYQLSVSFFVLPDDIASNAASAVSLAIGTRVFTSVGWDTDDADTFKVVAPADGRLTVQIARLNGDLGLTLTSASGVQVGSSNAAGLADERVEIATIASQPYYITVRGGVSDYVLTTSFLDQVLATGEGTDRAGDTIATAIGLPQIVQASVGFGTDVADYYRIVPPNTGVLVLQLSGLGQDADLFLFGASGTQVASSQELNTTSEDIRFNVVGGTTYYVGVRPYQDSKTFYTLNVDMDGATATDAGNSLDTARIYDPNQDLAGTVGFGSDSNDFFKFVAPADGTFTARLSGLSADLDLYLYDARGNRLAAPFVSGLESEEISRQLTAGTVFFLRVAPFQGSASLYDLDLSFQSTGNAISTVSDGNDTIVEATTVTLPLDRTDAAGFGADTKDYFKFTATATGTLTINLTGLSDDLDVVLYNSAGTKLTSWEFSGASDEQLIYEVIAGIQYVIGVEPYQGARSTYQLSTRFEANAPDSDGTFSTARVVSVPTTVSDRVGYGPDNADMYKIVAPANGFLFADLSGLRADIDLELYNVSGTLLASSNTAGTTSESVAFQVTAGSIYYVSVLPFQAAESPYRLRLNFIEPTDSAGNTMATAALMAVPGRVGEGSDIVDFFYIHRANQWSGDSRTQGFDGKC